MTVPTLHHPDHGAGQTRQAVETAGENPSADGGRHPSISLGTRVVSAIWWTAGVKIGFQLVTWAMTLAVIRILAPSDYGLMSLSLVFVNVLAGFSNLGLGDALIQLDETPRPLVASVFGLLLLLSAALTVLLAVLAYPLAYWYHDVRLVSLIQVSSLGFLITGLSTIPRVQLQKSLRVRPMFVMEMGSGVIGAVLVIVLAYQGWGVWALMLGGTLAGLVRLLGFAVLTAEYWVWPSFNFRLVRPLMSFGAFRTLDYLAWVAFGSADVLIIGRILGPENLGIYSVALNFAVMPLSKVAPIINQVAFPAFALVQGNQVEARFYALKAMRIMALVMVPTFFGISALAPEIVSLVFGPQWAAAENMLAVLGFAMSFRAILLVVPNFLQGMGDARAGFLCTLAGGIIFPPAFLIGCAWGIEGVCYAWVLAYPLVFLTTMLIASRRGQLDFRALLLTPLRPMAAGIAMVLAVSAVRPWVPGPEPIRAAILVATGAAVYTGIMAILFRPLFLEFLSLISSVRARRT